MAEDYINVNKGQPTKGLPGVQQAFLLRLEKEDRLQKEQYKPFCSACAHEDFDIMQKTFEAEYSIEKQRGADNIQEYALNIDKLDWKRYGDEKAFLLLAESEAKVSHPANKAIMIATEFRRIFKCKKRGHKRDVFIPIMEWNKLQGKGTKFDDYGAPVGTTNVTGQDRKS